MKLATRQILLGEKQKEIFEELAKAKGRDKVRSELKSLAIFAGLLGLAVGGRVALQAVPSVEPIIPIAVLAGLIFGMREGAMLGGTAYIISNFFVWGLQGPWTIFQALGGALAGGIGGGMGKIKKPSWKDLVIWSVVGTLFFELIMNVSGAFMGIGLLGGLGLFMLPVYFLMSLPFSAAHVLTNIGFAKLLQPLLKLRREKGGLQIVSVSSIADGKRTDVRMYKSE